MAQHIPLIDPWTVRAERSEHLNSNPHLFRNLLLVTFGIHQLCL
jgi:hypothetical protein